MKYILSEPKKYPIIGFFKSKQYGDVTFNKGDEFILPGQEEGLYDVYAIQNDQIIGKREKSGSFTLDNKAFGAKLFGLFKKEAKLTILAAYRGDSFPKGEGLNLSIAPHSPANPINGYEVTISSYYIFWIMGVDVNAVIKNNKNGMFNQKMCSFYDDSERCGRLFTNMISKNLIKYLSNEYLDIVKESEVGDTKTSYIGLDDSDPRIVELKNKVIKYFESGIANDIGIKLKLSIFDDGKKPYGLEQGKVTVATDHSFNTQYWKD